MFDYCGDERFSKLVGQTIKSIEGNEKSEELIFNMNDGKSYRMYYEPDCCASCNIEEIHGDLKDLIGTPILMAEAITETPPQKEDTRTESQKDYSSDDYEYFDNDESSTWTFYKLATIKGSVTIRWYGSSNGYYSERASFEEVGKSRYDD